MPAQCTWEDTNPLSPNSPEGCDADPLPDSDRCARHLTDQERAA